MPSKFEFNKGKMVPYPSGAIVPDRDLGQRPALECIHLGIEFGGLKAVDDFSLTIGKTEIAGLTFVLFFFGRVLCGGKLSGAYLLRI